MGFNLWRVKNDGIGGHAWLGPHDMLSLQEEMLAQGMAWQREDDLEEEEGTASSASPPARARAGIPVHKLTPSASEIVTPREVADALQAASAEPQTFSDRKLWEDWLAFLDGARRSGGILIR